MGGHIIQKWYECSIDDQNHDRYRIEFFDRSSRMKIFMVEIIDWLINENHDRHYQNRVFILETQSLWSKERSVMSSEDLKDWKEEASIGDAECQMQRLKLSIFANNSIKAIVILIINRAFVRLLNDMASHIIWYIHNWWFWYFKQSDWFNLQLVNLPTQSFDFWFSNSFV